jgi:predicted metal-dependent phosphoesterase TrpH
VAKKKKQQMQWYKMDLHLHTPASADWQEPGATYLDLLHRAEMQGLDIVAITDHNTVAGCAALQAEVEQLGLLERLGRIKPDEQRRLNEYRRIGDKVLVLPG